MKTQCPTTQSFGENANPSYVSGGLKGHTGWDNSCGFGTPINSYWDSEYVYKVLTKENPANDGSGFTGVFTIVEQDGKCFEFLYGHCNPSPNLLGTVITKGTVIGTEANNGQVYSGGERITLDMQKSGDTRGTHRHDQARLLRKDVTVQGDNNYLSSLGGGIFNYNGYFYAIPNYKNGFNGCYDFTQTTQPVAVPAQPNGVTDFIAALSKYQTAKGIKPYPKIGPLTLKELKKDNLI